MRIEVCVLHIVKLKAVNLTPLTPNTLRPLQVLLHTAAKVTWACAFAYRAYFQGYSYNGHKSIAKS